MTIGQEEPGKNGDATDQTKKLSLHTTQDKRATVVSVSWCEREGEAAMNKNPSTQQEPLDAVVVMAT